jgi:hypothetical protein
MKNIEIRHAFDAMILSVITVIEETGGVGTHVGGCKLKTKR